MNSTPVIVEEIIHAPVEKVWKALTDKEQMKQWYFTIADFKLEEGAVFSFYESDAKQFYHQCVIKEIIPNKKFQHTWAHPNHSKGQSVVTWNLESITGGTKVVLVHEGVENFADAGANFTKENYIAGWQEIVKISLKKFLEK